MSERLKKISKSTYKFLVLASYPMRRNLLFVVTMYAILAVCFWREKPFEGNYLLYFTEYFFDLYLLCLMIYLSPRKARPWVRLSFYLIGYLTAFFEVFLSERFLILYTPMSLQLFMETDTEEASEFMIAYMQGRPFQRALVFFGIIVVCNVALTIYVRRIYHFWNTHVKPHHLCVLPSRILVFLIPLFLLTSIAPAMNEKGKMLFFFRQKTTVKAENVHWQDFYTPLYRLAYSYKMLTLAQGDLETLKDNMHHLRVDRCTYRCPNIILVIGESYNKHHSQLYGYPRTTTPNQVRLRDNGSLVAFTDVVTPWNLTSNVFKNMLSTHSMDQEGLWYDGVLFPALFRKAGYRVAFMTNQYQNVNRQSGIDFNGSFFLNDPELDTLCFDFRNKKRYHYDRAFIGEYANYTPGKHNLIIFHLFGQHQKYNYRFSKDDAYFTPDSLADRSDLNRKEKQILADYDNATRYNDDVFARICSYFMNQDAIVVYVADHGEEAFDDIHTYGREPYEIVSPAVAYYEFEVPFVVWFSPMFKERHQGVVRRVRRAADRAFATDDLPHMLLGLAGISCPWYAPQRDLLSNAYNPSRPRLLRGRQNYDSLMCGTKYKH